ncbi:MAG: DUF3977 family protein [Rickettsiales bacterium]|nr:DUF3977 family protein [Rickettsiales bacterium]
MAKIYKEYGLDFDNNRFGFGKSTEVEYDDGTEYRTKENLEISGRKSYYFRLWAFKKVLIIDSNGIYVKSKKRNNLKIVFGASGKLQE